MLREKRFGRCEAWAGESLRSRSPSTERSGGPEIWGLGFGVGASNGFNGLMNEP